MGPCWIATMWSDAAILFSTASILKPRTNSPGDPHFLERLAVDVAAPAGWPADRRMSVRSINAQLSARGEKDRKCLLSAVFSRQGKEPPNQHWKQFHLDQRSSFRCAKPKVCFVPSPDRGEQ